MNEHFSFMYADLCRKITDNWSTGTENEEEESLGKSFRVKLLERYVLERSLWCGRVLSVAGSSWSGSTGVCSGRFPPRRCVPLIFSLLVVPSHTPCERPCRCKDEFSVDRAKKIEEIRALEGLSPEDKLEKVRAPLSPSLSPLSLSLSLHAPCRLGPTMVTIGVCVRGHRKGYS